MGGDYDFKIGTCSRLILGSPSRKMTNHAKMGVN